jgi:hypothetical protein
MRAEERFVPQEKKLWATPSVRSLDLEQVRALVQQAVELVESTGKVPDAVRQLKLALDKIDGELGKAEADRAKEPNGS